MFLNIDLHKSDAIALVDDSGLNITFNELIAQSNEFYKLINKRTLVFILADNSIESFIAFYSCIQNKVVPLLLSSNTNEELLNNLYEKYVPEFIYKSASNNWSPKNENIIVTHLKENGFELIQTNNITPILFDELSFLLPTSGSTGSPKLVRHSYANLNASAANVSELFKIDSSHAAIAFLPMYYTMGLSVIISHLNNGAKVILTNYSLTDRLFWNLMKEQKVTTFTGVPYSFELLDKLRFFRMSLPDLKIITQGGGKLKEDLFIKFAQYAADKLINFIPTYGQTEGTARMAFLEPSMTQIKVGSIGKAIPNGYLGVINNSGEEILTTEAEGEMIYKGKNVTLGYAECKEDLTLGDDNKGVLITGDIVKRDADGFYYIIGRKKRFLKIYGYRIGLDEVEMLIKNQFHIECICSGNDEQLIIKIENLALANQVQAYISDKTNLFHQCISVHQLENIARNEAGKVILTN